MSIILQLFKEWKDESSAFEFITPQTYEDLKWMVFGMAGVACTYLDSDKKKKIHQGRSELIHADCSGVVDLLSHLFNDGECFPL